MQQAIQPQWESKPDYWVFSELAKRMGSEAEFIEGFDEMGWIKRLYHESKLMDEKNGVKLPTFDAFWKKGYVLFDVKEKDRNYVAYADFRKDPKANPLSTESGLIQLYPVFDKVKAVNPRLPENSGIYFRSSPVITTPPT